MIGHINHRGFKLRLIRFEQFHHFREHVVGIDNRIVIGIADGLCAAIFQLIVLASWREFFKFFRVAFKVCGAMIAHGVQHD